MTNRKIISEWFHDYSNDVYNFLVYYRGNKDVQDLVQEVFIKATRGLGSFRNDASPKTWLFSIARHVAIDHARKEARRIVPIADGLEADYAAGSKHGPEDMLLEDEALQELYEAIRSLKANYTDVLILRGIEGMSVAETAEVLGWKESKVKVTYHRAKKSLEKQLSQKGALQHEA